MKLDATDIPDLKPVIAAVVAEVMANADKLNDRLAFPEAEAAALCGIAKHKLRDARLRGEVRGRLVGKTMVYEKGELLKFLRS